MKIVMYGIGLNAKKIDNIISQYNLPVTVCKYIQTIPDIDRYMNTEVISPYMISKYAFDYLVISSDKYYDEMLCSIKECSDDWENIQSKIVDYEQFMKILYGINNNMLYKSCRVDDLDILFRGDDEEIPFRMFCSGHIYAKDTMDRFIKLVEKYSLDKLEEGVFFDVGANIGTTTLYLGKKYSQMKVIAFEPSKENYILLKANCIINNMENVYAENMGVSNARGQLPFLFNNRNSGNSGITDDINSCSYYVDVISLDEYIQHNEIDPESVKALWVDVEGHEYNVILGAQELLEKRYIPLLQEFNPFVYDRDGVFDEYCQLMERLYSGFISMKDEEETYKDICELKNYASQMKNSGYSHDDLFFF